jgi:hypothetical protein
MSAVDDDVEEDFIIDDVDQSAPPPFQGDPGPSSSYPHPPQDPSGSTLAPAHPEDENFAVNMAAHFLTPSSLVICDCLSSYLFGVRCQKGGEVFALDAGWLLQGCASLEIWEVDLGALLSFV